MIKEMNKNVKKMNVWDIGLVKLTVVAAVLFIVRIWPAAMSWVHSVNAWWFLVAAVIFAIKPWSRMFGK